MKTMNRRPLGFEVEVTGGNDIRGTSEVNAACRRFFEKRGMEHSFKKSARFGRSARLGAAK